MRKPSRASRAILVLEAPWEVDASDALRSSVLPFVEGIAKLAGNVEVYHANFYDKNSFKKALEYLCKCRFENATVYLAAHGYKKKIHDIEIIKALTEIGMQSKSCKITGVMLGSCYVGGNTVEMEVCLEGTHLRWTAGYASECGWLTGTQIDCAILSSMLETEHEDFEDEDFIINRLGDAIKPFNGNAVIGLGYKEEEVLLRDSLRFVIQPTGKGRRAKEVTDEVIEYAYGVEKE